MDKAAKKSTKKSGASQKKTRVKAEEKPRKKPIQKKTRSQKDEEALEREWVRRQKHAIGMGFGVFLYIAAVAWIMCAVPVWHMNPVVSSAIMMLIIALATLMVVYYSIAYKQKKLKRKGEKTTLWQRIADVLALLTLIIYLWVSFATGAWHLTWVIWLILALVESIIKLIFALAGYDIEDDDDDWDEDDDED